MADTKLRVEIVENGYIYPLSPSLDGSFENNSFGGVLDSKYNFTELSQQLRYTSGDLNSVVSWNISPTLMQNFKKCENSGGGGDVCFCGIIHRHFGHFLIESISRLWFALRDDNLRCAFLCSGPVPNVFFEFMELLNIDKSRVLFIDRPLKFDRIYVPEASFYLDGRVTEEYLEIIDKILSNVPADKRCPDKLFLSSRYLNDCNFSRCGEKTLEKIFNKNGYKSFYPERMPLKEQVRYIKSASSLVTTQGTSSHVALFLSKGAKLVVLNRKKEFNYTQLLIDKLKQYQVTYLDASLNFINIESPTSPSLIGVTKEVEEYFKLNSFKGWEKIVEEDEIAKYLTACKVMGYEIPDSVVSAAVNDLNIKGRIYVNFYKFVIICMYYVLYKHFKLCKKKFDKYFTGRKVCWAVDFGKICILLR